MKQDNEGRIQLSFLDKVKILFFPLSEKHIQNDFLEHEVKDEKLKKIIAATFINNHAGEIKNTYYVRIIESRWFAHNKEVARNWAVLFTLISVVVAVVNFISK